MLHHDLTFTSNHCLNLPAELTGAALIKLQKLLLEYMERIAIVRGLELTKSQMSHPQNHSTMNGTLSHVPFNRVGEAKSTVQVHEISLSVNMTYANQSSRYVQLIYEKSKFLHLLPQFVNLQLESCGISLTLIVTPYLPITTTGVN